MPPRSARCLHCRCLFVFNPRLKDQRYCGRTECQRVRKRLWQRHKMATDADYQQNQKAAQKHWQQEHPDYWRQYRRRHPDYAESNRRLQQQRDRRRKTLAKMDALAQKITLIPASYSLPAASCKQGLDCLPGPTAR